MPLHVGGRRIARLYRGAVPIARAWRGAVQVFGEEEVGAPGFPLVRGTPATTGWGGVTSRNVNLPAGIEAGELLLMLLSGSQAARAYSAPGGWDELFQTAVGSGNNGARLACFFREASGSEGATVAVTNATGGQPGGGIAYRISDWDSLDFAVATDGGSAGDSPDPPSLAPAGGAGSFLWLAAIAASPERTLTSYPAGYANGVSALGTFGNESNADDSRCSAAQRALAAAGENPGVFSLNSTARWVAATVSVRGT